MVLPRASCKICAEVTSRFERTVARAMYGPFRLKHGMQSRHPGKRPDKLALSVTKAGSTEEATMGVAEYPLTYLGAHLPEPGLLRGAPLTASNPELTLEIRGDPAVIKAGVQSLDAESVGLSALFYWKALCLQIAKVAHSYAVAQVGLGSFTPYLPDIILGRSPFVSHYVGGTSADTSGPELEMWLQPVAHLNVLTVRVRLLAGRLPPYQAVVGEVLDVRALYWHGSEGAA
jgi:hypothetical protein